MSTPNPDPVDTHTLRCKESTWERLRTMAFFAKRSIGEQMTALLDEHDARNA